VKRAPVPHVSVVIAAHDAAATLGAAVGSVLRQTVRELEVVVVDDGSSDDTPELLSRVTDPRLLVVRNDRRQGLAASLNRGLDTARARWVARLDADDVALPERLETQLARLDVARPPALLGSAVLEFREELRVGGVHEAPLGPTGVRWHALFGAPVFHPTVLVDRELLDRHGLRYETGFDESEDYDLWTRVLAHGEGDNVRQPLVLRRVHPGQASKRRRDLQRSLQRQVALREIGVLAPRLDPGAALLAWRAGVGDELASDEAGLAADALLELLAVFSDRHRGAVGLSVARSSTARALARVAVAADTVAKPGIARRALELDAGLPLAIAAARARRALVRQRLRPRAERLLADLHARWPEGEQRPVRVTVVSPEPTPYRSPLFDRIAARPEVELTVIYAGETVAGRTWQVEPRHPSIVLDGVRVPGVRRALRHDYPVTPDVLRALRDADPDVVVAHGWSTFASQAAIVWSRRHGIPYVLLVSSHDAVDRARWRQAVRRPIVPPVVRGAWGGLALGTLSRESLVAHGLPPSRVRLFANTIDVGAVGEQAARLAATRPALREALGLRADDVAVLSAGRLAPEKAHDTLIHAVAAVEEAALSLVIAGEGPERAVLERLAGELGVRLTLTGDLPWERLLEAYVAADVFALLSTWEPWGVVVNEAAACGLPLVLSDGVGAAPDLLRDGENGTLVPAGDVTATAAALRRLAADPALRETQGARSRELVAGWGYEPSVESFVQTVLEASGRPYPAE
jgi:glycosyltransferase involved in cell wall biosynthesis/GT2 family glycosyltransferase